MKKIIISCFILIVPVLLHAQITIGTVDMPIAGHIYPIVTGQASGTADFATTGANTTWDFSSLTVSANAPDTILSIAQLPITYIVSFFTSTFAERANGNMSLGLSFALQNVYNVFKNTSSSFRQTGFGGEVQGTALPVFYNPNDEIYQFPLNFNNTFSSNSAYVFQLPTIATFGQQRSRTTTVDGWGTLILPNGSYQVLRVKSDITDIDSIYVDQFGTGFNLPVQLTHEYKWLAVGKGTPMLQINTNDILGNETVSSIRYQDFGPSAIENISADNSEINIFPNPTSDYAFVMPSEKFQNEKMLITDVTGRVLNEISVSSTEVTTIDLTRFSEGIYFVQIINDGNLDSVQKLIVNR